MIANTDGKMVVGQFGSFIWGFMQGYDGTVEEGDIFLTSDPYSVNGAISHANDWLMLMPVYRAGRIIAWSAMFGHMTDVGGKVPGSLPTDGTTIYEDGIVVPPTKIYKAGKLNEDVLRVVLHNCRLPHWNLSDFNAITAALRTAEARCVEIAERFGDDVFYSAMDAMLERNKRAMRALIRQNVPETKQFFEDYICDDGLNMGPYRIKCAMWREGDKCIFDFTGTDPQSISSINFLLNEEMFKMFAGIYMIMVFDPQILFNDGFYDCPAGPTRSDASSTSSRACWVRATPTSCAAPASRTARTSCTRVTTRTASGTSCTRSPSAASRASPSATARTATRCGPRSPTCRTSSSRATSRCASTSTRPSRTPAAPARTAAATACASATASSNRARSRSTTTVGSPTPGAPTAASRAPAAASCCSALTVRRSSCPPRSTM
jgi:N-methylhydantoinase B/oxoprolinase/acetone carboxylase alpha subunit